MDKIELDDATERAVNQVVTAAVAVGAGVLAALAYPNMANVVTLLVIALLAVSALFTTGDGTDDADSDPSPISFRDGNGE